MNGDYVLRDYNVDDIRDAERLGKMFVSFDSAWPGGFMNGAAPSPEHMFESMRRMQRLAICVVEHQDEFVGYCDLHAQTGNTDLAYIPLLGASPDHHGKGVGKALLLELIGRVTALGFRELTLNTWAGNMKAVPLYKKTGFNWEPDTSVLMRNFMPGLLNSAPGKAFFSGRDWYACMERDLETAPDDTTWNGMKVFPYSFRDGAEILKATFEMASGGMTALETSDYSVWCSIPTSYGQAPSGAVLPITWHVSPKSGSSLEVVLLTEGDDGLDIKVREHLRVTEPTDITRSLSVLATAEPKHYGERERSVRSTLVLNGVPIILETGVRVIRPISIEYSGQGLFPGRQEKIEIQLKNNLEAPVTGRLSLDANPNLTGSGAALDFSIPGRLSTRCTFLLTAIEPGACLTNLRYEADGIRGSRPLAFRVYGSIAPVASIETAYDEEIVLESPGMKMTHSLRGGALHINNKSAQHSWRIGMPEPGPPFASMRRRKILASGRLEQIGADTAVVIRVEYPEYPGLVIERHAVQLAGELVRLDFRLINTTALDMPLKLRFSVGHGEAKQIALPLETGIVCEPTSDWDHYPMGGEDALRKPDGFTESWIAAGSDHKVYGLIWNGSAHLEMDWHTGITLEPGTIKANSSTSLLPLYIVVGSGNWETVRGWWRKLVQPSHIKEKAHPAPKRVLQIRTAQSPLLLTENVTSIDLVAENDRGRPITGDITLEANGLAIEPTVFAVKELNRDTPVRLPMTIIEENGFGAGVIRAAFTTAANCQTFKLPVIRIASSGTLSVSQQSDGRYLVQNGVLSYTVAPDFLGSITDLECAGVNYLHSAWPKHRAFMWANPWYGGIHPFLDWIGEEKLAREKFKGQPIERVGETGHKWQGVRVACEPQHRDLRWLRVEADYLTLPGSDLLALVYRWTNISGAPEVVYGGMAVWTSPGGDREKSVTHWSSNGELRHRRRTSPGLDVNETRWAAVESEATGARLEAVATGKKGWACINDMAEEGAHFGVGGEIKLEPGETSESIAWLVVNPAISELEAYGALHTVEKLP